MGEDVDLKDLYEQFKEDMFEDYVYKGNPVDKSENLAKADIERMMQINGQSLANYKIDMPVNVDIDELELFDKEKEKELGETMVNK